MDELLHSRLKLDWLNPPERWPDGGATTFGQHT